MNIPLSKHKYFKPVAIAVAIVVVVGLGLLAKNKWAFSQTPDPEASVTDLSGNARTSFASGESVNLSMRIYGEDLTESYRKSDIILLLDLSSRMNAADPSNPGKTKLDSAKDAMKTFIDNIDTAKQMQIGLVGYEGSATYSGVAYTTSQLVVVNSSTDKTNLKTLVDSMQTLNAGELGLGSGAQAANTELLSARARSDADKFVILFSTGLENSAPFTNTNKFDETYSNNRDAATVSGSELERAVSNKIRYFSIYYGDTGSSCSLEANATDASYGGCPLLRFISARTNGQALATGFTDWSHDYLAKVSFNTDSVDGIYLYKSSSSAEVKEVYKKILYFITASSAQLDTYIKMPSGAQFEEVVSAIDKSSDNHSVLTADQGNGTYKFSVFGVTGTNDNYVDLKIKLKLNEVGDFDLLSNFKGCGAGPLQELGENSYVKYLDMRPITPEANRLIKTLAFKSLCVRVFKDSPNITKYILSSDPSGDPQNPKNIVSTFEAGQTVWVELEIDEMIPERRDFAISDQVPATVSGELSYKLIRPGEDAKSGKINASNSIVEFKPTALDSKSVIESLKRGKNYIIYSYKL